MEFIIASIISALIGLILGVIFEESLNGLKYKIQKKFKKIFKHTYLDTIPHNFAFGTIETPVIIIEGDIEVGFSPQNLNCYYEPTPIAFPKELLMIKEKISTEEEQKKINGEMHMWNGQTYALLKYNRSRSVPDEEPILNLWFKRSDWFSHLATSWSMDTEFVFDEKKGKMVTLKEKYFLDYDWSNSDIQPHPFFSNAVGIAVCLVTSDEYLIVVKRSELVVAPVGYSIPINETIQYPFDRACNSFAPDLYRTTIRGSIEEFGIDIKQSEITFLALAVNTENNLWAVLGVANTELNLEEVVKSRRINSKDKFESSEILKVKFDIKPVVDFVVKHKPWVPGALPCIYYSLAHKFGREKVDRVIKECMK